MLQALPGKLSLHEADLLKDGSFDEIVKGADYVFHMASPFLSAWEDTQKELVEPALHGTTTVLGSVAKSKDTVRRVVLTSSLAGVVFPLHDRSLLSPHATSYLPVLSSHTEDCWSPAFYLRYHLCYFLHKRLCLFAAALKMKSGPSNGKLYTEEDWNTDSEADKEGGYMYSKVCLV